MKTFTLISLLVLLSSCTAHKVISSISVTTELADENELLLNIEAIDNDGISSIVINIKAFDYKAHFDEIYGNNWNFERTFTLGHLETEPTVEVTLTDTKGNQRTTIKSTKLE